MSHARFRANIRSVFARKLANTLVATEKFFEIGIGFNQN